MRLHSLKGAQKIDEGVKASINIIHNRLAEKAFSIFGLVTLKLKNWVREWKIIKKTCFIMLSSGRNDQLSEKF